MREPQNKAFPIKSTLNCGGNLLDLSEPKVMAILNVTPDSFFDGGQYSNINAVLRQVEKHISEGAAIIDIGAVSTRPGSETVSISEELNRLIPAIDAICRTFPGVIISADTYRGKVAKKASESGATMINDISGGTLDQDMFKTIAELQLPYVMMHIQGTPQTMQINPSYHDLLTEVFDFFKTRVHELQSMGAKDIIIDLGFGFGKTLDDNFELLKNMQKFQVLGCPILAGLSRKSMINKVLGTKAKEALNGTTALNMLALQNGANLLRVHDVKEAMECIALSKNL